MNSPASRLRPLLLALQLVRNGTFPSILRVPGHVRGMPRPANYAGREKLSATISSLDVHIASQSAHHAGIQLRLLFRTYLSACLVAGGNSTFTNFGRLDAGSRILLDRIDRLEKTLLEASWCSQASYHNATPASANNMSTAVGEPLSEKTSFFTVEGVLAWPIFQEQYRSCLNLRDLMQAPHSATVMEHLSPQSMGKGPSLMTFELDSCSTRLDHFFSRVHIKNPVLDEHEIRRWAREISFNGIGWDARSCLVVSLPSPILF
jgi:hypothetical protein